MNTANAKREDIQKRLQILREEREREQRAYDELQHSDIPAADIARLAREKAVEDVVKVIDVSGKPVALGDFLTTVDEPSRMVASETGYMVIDRVKMIYLGERGEVTRIMPDFQGKPAVELRFADGAKKVFFTDCLNVGGRKQPKASSGGPPVSVAPQAEGGALPPGGAASSPASGVPAAASSAQPSPPSWGMLMRPGSNKVSRVKLEEGARGAGVQEGADAPIRPVGAATGENLPLPRVEQSSKAVNPPVAPTQELKTNLGAAMPARSEPSTCEMVATTIPCPGKEPKPPSLPKQSNRGASARTPATPGARSEVPYPTSGVPDSAADTQYHEAAVGLVPQSLSTSGWGSVAEMPAENLGSPVTSRGAVGIPASALPISSQHVPDEDNLLKTPRVDLFHQSPYPTARRQAPVALLTVDISDVDSGIPSTCPSNYVAKFPLSEKSSIPRYRPPLPPRVKHCYVGGYTPRQKEPIQLISIAFRENIRSLEAVLAAVTRELKWSAKGKRVERLFSAADGAEIMWIDAIRDGMALVGTIGNSYTPGDVPIAERTAHICTSRSSGLQQHRSSSRTSSAPPRSRTPGTPTSSKAKGPPPSLLRATMSRNVVSPAPRRPSPTRPRPSTSAPSLHNSIGASGRSLAATGDRGLRRTNSSPKAMKGEVAKRQGSGIASSGKPKRPVVAATGSPTASAKRPLTGPRRTGITAGGGRPIQVRVFVNGEYGDRLTDRLPFRTVTIRPTHKSLVSIRTMITRELQWNGTGQKVEVLYNVRGGEIVALPDIVDGDAIVASAGDRFIIPHITSVLHEELERLNEEDMATVPPPPLSADASDNDGSWRDGSHRDPAFALGDKPLRVAGDGGSSRSASGLLQPSQASVNAAEAVARADRLLADLRVAGSDY